MSLHFSNGASAGRAQKSRARIEWPTVLLAIAIYGGWALMTWFWSTLSYPLLFILGGWIIAWHGSLQHEVLHGHPTRFRVINDAVGWPPISIWLPYRIYKRSHLTHHNDEWLTDPIEDPESYYFTGDIWAQTGSFGRLIAMINNTLLGRLIIGPLVALVAFFSAEIGHMMRGDFHNGPIWLRHIAGCAVIFWWVISVCQMPLWVYLTAFVYSGLAISRLRSFAEHQYAGAKEERTAIVENTPAFGLLFLHNNLHIVHHMRPQIAWYKIPALYKRERDDFVRLNGGLVYNGYWEVARRYLFRPHHDAVHPHHMDLEPQMAADPAGPGDQASVG